MIDFLPIPEFFELFGYFRVSWWGLIFAVSVVLFIYLFLTQHLHFRIGKWKMKRNEAELHLPNILIHFLFWSFIAGHFYRVIFVMNNYSYLFNFRKGIDSFGFVIGFIAVMIYLKYHKLPVEKYFDYLAIPFITFLTTIRIGCALVCDETGIVTDVAWAVFYKGALRHPVGVYYFLTNLILLIVVIYLYKNFTSKNKLGAGNLFLITMILYSFKRILLDFYRAIPDHSYIFLWTNLSIHQVAYGLLMVVLLLFLIKNINIGKIQD